MIGIEGVLGLSWGKSFTTDDFAQGYTHVLVVLFKDKSYINGYYESQLHTDLKKLAISYINKE